jgi:hypothetical protein
MKRLSKQEVINRIIKASNDYGANPCTMLTFASIETGGTFDNMANNNNTYLGVFQLSNGYGGVKGDDRYDPYKSCIGAINGIQELQDTFKKKNLVYYDFYAYLRHQQGLSGLLSIIENKDKPIENYERATALKRNVPKSVELDYVGDFLNYWSDVYDKKMSECSIKCTVSGLSDSNCVITYNNEYYSIPTIKNLKINYNIGNRNYYL